MFVKLQAQPGKREELLAALQPLFDAVGAESGTLVYAAHVSDDEPDVVRFYELYESEDALALHGTSDAMRAAGPSLAPLLAGRPEMVKVRPVSTKGIGS